MTPQEELDRYGNIIIASTKARKLGEIIDIYDTPSCAEPIGKCVITQEATRSMFEARDKMHPIPDCFKYFNFAEAE